MKALTLALVLFSLNASADCLKWDLFGHCMQPRNIASQNDLLLQGDHLIPLDLDARYHQASYDYQQSQIQLWNNTEQNNHLLSRP